MAAGMAAASLARVRGANERVRLGIIGTGGRGSYLMTEANKCPNIQWVALCDAWDQRRDEAARLTGGAVEKYSDYRRLLDRQDIDAVIVATWDNMHARITMDACRSGKDVYVEKPMTSVPEQGPEVVRVVRETKRVVQVGVQQRSTPHFEEARQRFFESGLIGRVHMVRTVWNANGGYLTPVPAGMEAKPAALDWEACLGWLPKIPWDPKRYFNRFAYWDLSSGGQTGGLLVHMIDVVYWFLNNRKPLSAVALGGIYQYDDGRDTPDNINVILDYPDNLNVTFEATLTDMIPKENEDIVFMGTGGRLSIFRSRYRFIPAGSKNGAGEILVKGGPDRHMQNWIDCVRSRKEPNANVIDGHYGAMACHIANLAYREKARVNWKPEWDV